MHPRLVLKQQLDAFKKIQAIAEGLARMEKALARLERKVDALAKSKLQSK